MGGAIWVICLMVTDKASLSYGSPLTDMILDMVRPLHNKTWFRYLEFDFFNIFHKEHYSNVAEYLLRLNIVARRRSIIPITSNTRARWVKQIKYSIYGFINYNKHFKTYLEHSTTYALQIHFVIRVPMNFGIHLTFLQFAPRTPF